MNRHVSYTAFGTLSPPAPSNPRAFAVSLSGSLFESTSVLHFESPRSTISRILAIFKILGPSSFNVFFSNLRIFFYFLEFFHFRIPRSPFFESLRFSKFSNRWILANSEFLEFSDPHTNPRVFEFSRSRASFLGYLYLRVRMDFRIFRIPAALSSSR